MNKLSILLAAVIASASLPALAGPNWRIIHDERRDAAFQAADCAPLDHGPRAQTTQWLNRKLAQRIEMHDSHKAMLSSSKPAATHS